MTTDFLTLLLAPICVGLLLLYLQQLGQTRGLRDERESALDKLAKAKKKIEDDAAQNAETFAAAKKKYQEEIDRKQEEIDGLKTSVSRARIAMEFQSLAHRMDSKNSLPGSDAGS